MARGKHDAEAGGLSRNQLRRKGLEAGTDHGRAKAARRRVAWLAASALLFQLFITQVHAFMGGATWALDQAAASAAETAAPFICHFGLDGPAIPSDPATAHHPECPIYQSLPMVSAALAAGFVELPTPPAYEAARASFVSDPSPRSASLGLRPEPRAPPVQA
jgi:hypothetical protein